MFTVYFLITLEILNTYVILIQSQYFFNWDISIKKRFALQFQTISYTYNRESDLMKISLLVNKNLALSQRDQFQNLK